DENGEEQQNGEEQPVQQPVQQRPNRNKWKGVEPTRRSTRAGRGEHSERLIDNNSIGIGSFSRLSQLRTLNEQVKEFNLLYTAALTQSQNTPNSDDFYEDSAVEMALAAMNAYEPPLEAGDPTSFDEILRLPDRPLWLKSCRKEVDNLIDHD